METKSISGQWDELDNQRQTMLSKLQRFSELTVPSVMADEFYDEKQDQLTQSWSSLGAQAVTHLTNKLMLTMFAPSNPFVRLELEPRAATQLMADLQITDAVLTDVLSSGERLAIREMERLGIRPMLFELLLHLVTIGNVLLDLSGKEIKLHQIRDYVVKRSRSGRVILLIIREEITVGELTQRAYDEYKARYPMAKDSDCVKFYRRICLEGSKYYEDAAVGDFKLSPAFNARYTKETCPYHALTWRLPLKSSYGVGRVEDYFKDFGSHDMQSMAMTQGSILASQFRWAINPAGTTRAEDFLNTANGAAIPGSIQDVAIIFANIGQQLNTVMSISQEFARRIGHGFLINSAVTRDAERVTVEEIRVQAQELEGSLGGVYSRLALDIQLPLAKYLLKSAKFEIEGTKIEPVILTGLEALSRSADLDRLTNFLGDVATLDTLQPSTRDRLNDENIMADIAAGNSVARGRVLVSEQQFQDRQRQRQADAIAAASAEAGAKAGAAAAVQPTEET